MAAVGEPPHLGLRQKLSPAGEFLVAEGEVVLWPDEEGGAAEAGDEILETRQIVAARGDLPREYVQRPPRPTLAERRAVEVELLRRELPPAHRRGHQEIDEGEVALRAEAADRAAEQLREPFEMKVAVDRPCPTVAHTQAGGVA